MADATRRVFRDVALLAGKDLRLEAKSRVGLAQVLPFGVLVLVVMAFALDAESRLLIEVSPGLFWVTVTFAAVLTVIFLIWARASLVVFAIFYTREMPNLSGFLTQVLSMENLEFLLVYCGVGFIFALLVFAVSVVSIPLMLDRNQDAVTSMLASIRALAENPLPLLVWAALIVGLTLLGFMSFHIGLAVLMPVVGHATWHAYRDLVEPLKT